MKRLAVLSDVHIDINQLAETEWAMLVKLLLDEHINHVHLAGDIANTKQQALAFLDYLSNYFPTTFHWGNHEMADLTEGEIEHYLDPRFLNFRFFALSDTTWLLGINGWYDRFIQREARDPVVMQQIAENFVAIMRTVPKDKRVIVSTHFVPNQAFVQTFTGKYAKWNQINAFLGSPKIGQMATEFLQIKALVFGHTHHRFGSVQVGGIHYECRPLGYAYEWRSMREALKQKQQKQLTMAALKREWQQSAKEMYRLYPEIVEQELKAALTILPYEEEK
ncbi:metallophosphoesterase [Enterococcus italicus]|uniref:metallophosphoesterase n=1 Tax=Enterococcus italicus TaxID=246144 RepID=UPI0020731209|nr:metallophosphoesterase [Enterococcus italicus]MCM6931914.1 metallophosphoesterase [Enterococcus italicus]